MIKKPEKFILGKVEEFTDLKHLLRYGQQYGKKTYFTNKDKETKNIIHTSFEDMNKLVDKLGTAFFKLNLKNIALISETRYEWMATYFAATTGNGVIIPLDKELAHEQIINFIERASSDCIVYADEFADLIESYAQKDTAKPRCFVNLDCKAEEAKKIRESKNINMYSFAEMLEMGEKALNENCRDFVDAVIDNTKMCACLFTSGTTGTSKAVMLSHRNLASCAYHSACCVEFDDKDVVVAVLPAHHTYETSCTFLATYALGTEVCANESLKTVIRNFQLFKPTKLVLVPLFVETMAKRIWDEIEKKGKTKTVKKAIKLSNSMRAVGIDLRSKLFKEVLAAFGGRLEGIICGAAPLNSEYIKTFDNFGISIWQGYGTTECSPLISVNPSNMHLKKIYSVGYPIGANEVKIDNPDSNGSGEILVKGSNVMIGYLDDEEATKEVMTDDGFYRTGDIGHLDKDGYLYITGRKKNVIILSNGKNIYPEEIEEYLLKIDIIKECVVLGRATSQSSDVLITAVVYPDYEKLGNDFTKEQIEEQIKKLITQINKELPTFKHINNIEIRDTEFEKTTTKKIKRHTVQ